MLHMGSINMQTATTFGTLMMALLAIFVRSKASHKPATAAKIIMPPVGMSTGFLMFAVPATHIPPGWGLTAFLAGALLFSYPLIRSSKLEVSGGEIYVQKSKQFIFVLLGLLAIRLALHSYIEQFVSIPQTGALFFLLAFGMLLPWRIAMFVRFRKLQSELLRTP